MPSNTNSDADLQRLVERAKEVASDVCEKHGLTRGTWQEFYLYDAALLALRLTERNNDGHA